jgi:hypothetical protein
MTSSFKPWHLLTSCMCCVIVLVAVGIIVYLLVRRSKGQPPAPPQYPGQVGPQPPYVGPPVPPAPPAPPVPGADEPPRF